MSNTKETLPAGAVTVGTAKQNIDAWNALNAEQKGTYLENVIAFHISNEDLQGLLSEGAYGLRTYFGLKEFEGNLVPTTYVVATDSSGKDLLDPDKNQYAYDFVKPCPATCDCTSPLMDGFNCP